MFSFSSAFAVPQALVRCCPRHQTTSGRFLLLISQHIIFKRRLAFGSFQAQYFDVSRNFLAPPSTRDKLLLSVTWPTQNRRQTVRKWLRAQNQFFFFFFLFEKKKNELNIINIFASISFSLFYLICDLKSVWRGEEEKTRSHFKNCFFSSSTIQDKIPAHFHLLTVCAPLSEFMHRNL